MGPPSSLLPLISGQPKGLHLTGGGCLFEYIEFFEAAWECFQGRVMKKKVSEANRVEWIRKFNKGNDIKLIQDHMIATYMDILDLC
jgi:hypothetical protein